MDQESASAYDSHLEITENGCTDTPSLQHHDIYNVPRHFQTQRKWFFEPLVTALEILYLPNCPSSVDIDFYTADFFLLL